MEHLKSQLKENIPGLYFTNNFFIYIYIYIFYIKKFIPALADVAQLVGAASPK